MHVRANKVTCNQFEMTDENGEAPVFKSDNRRLLVNSYLFPDNPAATLHLTYPGHIEYVALPIDHDFDDVEWIYNHPKLLPKTPDSHNGDYRFIIKRGGEGVFAEGLLLRVTCSFTALAVRDDAGNGDCNVVLTVWESSSPDMSNATILTNVSNLQIVKVGQGNYSYELTSRLSKSVAPLQAEEVKYFELRFFCGSESATGVVLTIRSLYMSVDLSSLEPWTIVQLII